MKKENSTDVLFFGPIPIAVDELLGSLPYLKGQCTSFGIMSRFIDTNQKLYSFCDSDSRYAYVVEQIQTNKFDSYEVQRLMSLLFDEILTLAPKIIGVSLLSNQNINFALFLLRFINENFPHIKIIIGGKGCISQFPQSEEIFYEYCFMNNLVDEYEKHDGIEKILTMLGLEFDPMREFTPCYSDFDLEKYRWQNKKKISYVTSRGCVRRCEFCDIPNSWPIYTWEPAEKIIKQLIEIYQTTKINHVNFVDSLVNGNLKNFTRMLELMYEAMLRGDLPDDFSWSGTYIIRPINEKIYHLHDLIAKTNGHGLTVGVETGSERIRIDEMNKRFKNQDLIDELTNFSKLGITCNLLFFPSWYSETRDDLNETIKLFEQLQPFNKDQTIHSISLGESGFVLVEGTPVYNKIDQLDIIKGPHPKLWHCKNNPSLNYWESLERRFILQKKAIELGYELSLETMFLDHVYYFIKNNKKMIVDYIGLPMFSLNYEFEQDNEIFVSMTIVNTSQSEKTFKINEISKEFKLDYGVHHIEFEASSDVLTFEIKGIEYLEGNIRNWENGETYSENQLFIEKLFINGIDMTLSNFHQFIDFQFQKNHENRNPRSLLSNCNMTFLFENRATTKLMEAKRYNSYNDIIKKTENLINYIKTIKNA